MVIVMLHGCATRAGATDLVGKNISVAISRYGQPVKIETTNKPNIALLYFDKNNGSYYSSQQTNDYIDTSKGHPEEVRVYNNQWKKSYCSIRLYVDRTTKIITDYSVRGCTPEWVQEMFLN